MSNQQRHISAAHKEKLEKYLTSMESEGAHLISRWAQALTDKGYEEFARELLTAYGNNIARYQDYNDEGKRSAYKAMESVFGKVQREAVKRGDFETATAAKYVVSGAQSALDDMRADAGTQRGGITREEAKSEYGIDIPEEDEVCV